MPAIVKGENMTESFACKMNLKNKERCNSHTCYVRNDKVIKELYRIKLPILPTTLRTNDTGVLVSTEKEQHKPV